MALNCDIEVPCVVQWSMLWFSPPTILNRRFLDSGTKVEKFNDVKDVAIEATFTLSFGWSHTPRMCLLRSVSAVLYRTPEKDWDVHREVKGWGLREWLVLLTYDDVSENDLNDGRNP